MQTRKTAWSFHLLWTGQALSRATYALYTMSITFLIYETWKLVSLAALVPVIRVAAMLLGGIIAPLVMEKWRLKAILVFSQAMQTVLLGLLALFVWLAFNHADWSGVIPFIFIIALLESWTTPARNALIPRLADKDKLVKANSLLGTTDQIVLLLGWSLGGVLMSFIGVKTMFAICFGLFTLSTLAMAFIKDPVSQEENRDSHKSKWHMIREGWLYIASNAKLRVIMWMDIVEGLAWAAFIGAIILVFVEQRLHIPQQNAKSWWGFINASYFAGSILGGMATYAISNKVKRRLGTLMAVGSLIFAGLLVLVIWNQVPWITLVLFLCMAPAYQFRIIATQTLFQSGIDEQRLPKAMAAKELMDNVLYALSIVLLSNMTDRFGIAAVYGFVVALTVGAGAIAFAKRKMLDEHDSPAIGGADAETAPSA